MALFITDYYQYWIARLSYIKFTLIYKIPFKAFFEINILWEINIASVSYFTWTYLRCNIHEYIYSSNSYLSVSRFRFHERQYPVFISHYIIFSGRCSRRILNPTYLIWKIDLTLCGGVTIILSYLICDNIMLN